MVTMVLYLREDWTPQELSFSNLGATLDQYTPAVYIYYVYDLTFVIRDRIAVPFSLLQVRANSQSGENGIAIRSLVRIDQCPENSD